MNDTREITGKGHTYLITRRFLDRSTGRMRVRVRIFDGFRYSSSVPTVNEYRDYDDMHEGDKIFARHIAKITAHVNSKD